MSEVKTIAKQLHTFLHIGYSVPFAISITDTYYSSGKSYWMCSSAAKGLSSCKIHIIPEWHIQFAALNVMTKLYLNSALNGLTPA